MDNQKFVQIKGPFAAGEELVDRIKDNASNFDYIKKIGIQTKVANRCKINNIIFEIGKTGILEFNNVEINSLLFMQNEPDTTLIDCIIE